MKLLLDTHSLIWTAASSRRLSRTAAQAIGDFGNQVLVSAASLYEIEFKRPHDPELGALPPDMIEMARRTGFEWLPISPEHAARAGRLPWVKRDPWDRLLAAQALAESAMLVTADPVFPKYGVPVLW